MLCRIGDAYKRNHEVHRVDLFDLSVLHNQLSFCVFRDRNIPILWSSAAPPSLSRFLCHTTACNRSLTVRICKAIAHHLRR